MTSTWLWFVFVVSVAAMMAIDLGVLQKKAHAVSMREAAIWSLVWVMMALGFCGVIWATQSGERAMLFLTGYVLEKTLSVDNLFVFVLIFHYFSIPPEHQSRILHWGILGAIAMRFVFIFAGVALIQSSHFVLYLFGGILLWTGLKMLFAGDEKPEPHKNPALRLLHKLMPVTEGLHGQNFTTTINGKLHATPLLAALVVVEASDLLFAIDSVPAALAVTPDLFLVYTSNIFAVMGLRALYFLLAGSMLEFKYLKTGISLVLVFIGVKLIAQHWYKMPVAWSLAVIGGTLTAAIVASIVSDRRASRRA